MLRKGSVFLSILILAVVILGAGVFFNISDNKTKFTDIEVSNITPTLTLTPTFTITPTPRQTPIPTRKPIPTKIPTLTPTPGPNPSDCSKFRPEDGLATVTIKLKEKDGKELFGDWVVEIKPTGSCPAILPYGNYPFKEIIRQGTYTYTTFGFHPGQVRIDVRYHYTGEGFDIDATSGNHVREVTVSN